MILFRHLRYRFWENKFRNYHEVWQSKKWLSIKKLSRIMFATFCEVFEPRNSLSNSLRANYENFDRIEDRKLAITFKVRNCPISCWPLFTEKCSRNRSKLVSGSSPIEPTWFLPLVSKIFFKIEFYEKFMGFLKKFFFKMIKKTLRTRSKQWILYMFYISKVSFSQGIQPTYISDELSVETVIHACKSK